MEFFKLSMVERNVLFGSILGDGTLTKICENTRRTNSNYRENFSLAQLPYRQWKVSMLDNYLYFNNDHTAISSKSQLLFTQLEEIFYGSNRTKRIPSHLLQYCISPHFLAVLYLDDGSLSISTRVNHRKKKIYLTPHIYLYLQSFHKEDLLTLSEHLKSTFGVNLVLQKRGDGTGFVLKTTTVADTFDFLNAISSVTIEIPAMAYKTDWDYRLQKETVKWQSKHPNYKVCTSDRKRSRAYSQDEIQLLTTLKQSGYTDQQIAQQLGRTYWSVVYKLRELRNADR